MNTDESPCCPYCDAELEDDAPPYTHCGSPDCSARQSRDVARLLGKG